MNVGYSHRISLHRLSSLGRIYNSVFLQCFDAVGWAAGRASGL